MPETFAELDPSDPTSREVAATQSGAPDGQGADGEGATGWVQLRLSPKNHGRLSRLTTQMGMRLLDDAAGLLLDLYELNSGTFAPTDIKDLSALIQQQNVLLAALNATHLEIVDHIRSEHCGTAAKLRAMAIEVERELERLRSTRRPS